MASVVIRRAWFGRPAPGPGAGIVVKVPVTGAVTPQVSEAAFTQSLAPYLTPGTRTTQAAGAVTVGNVVSSTPAGGATAPVGSAVAYLVSV
jgi:hypothetical protein